MQPKVTRKFPIFHVKLKQFATKAKNIVFKCNDTVMIKFGNTVEHIKNQGKWNYISVSSWHHYQVKNATEKIIHTKSKVSINLFYFTTLLLVKNYIFCCNLHLIMVTCCSAVPFPPDFYDTVMLFYKT